MTKPTDCGCNEYRELSRRGFLGVAPGAALAAAAAAAAPAWVPRVALAKDHNSARDVLVNVFLRGGADAINMLVPAGDPDYYGSRPTIGVQSGDLIPLNGTTFYALCKPLAPLATAYNAGHLAFVPACGTGDPTRSHFDAQKFMEFGTPNQPASNIFSGWIGRHLQTTPPKGGPIRGVAISNTLPKALAGGPGVLPIRNPANFTLAGRAATADERTRALLELYETYPDPMGSAALDTVETIAILNQLDIANYQPANNAQYPTSAFGTALKSAAAMIRGDIGVEVIEVDRGGWDTHASQGTISGTMQALMDDLAQSLAAFYADISASHLSTTTVTVMSEFGRRCEENGSLGTDHGHAGMMMVLGGNILGGQVYGQWPGMGLQYRYNGLDLKTTTDYRLVLSEIVQKRLGNPQTAAVFPNYTAGSFLGIAQ